MEAAGRVTDRSARLDFTGLALEVYSDGGSATSLTKCRSVRRAIGRQELASGAGEPDLKPSEMQRRFGLGEPTVLVSNSESSSRIMVCVDYYDEYYVTSKEQLLLKLESGVHHLKFAPGGGGNSIEGKIDLELNCAYSWSFTVEVREYTVYRYE
jgi:hypothetical protein